MNDTVSRTAPSSNGEAKPNEARVNWEPHLIRNWLNESEATTFVLPVTWEVLKIDARDDHTIEYAGLIDYARDSDRKALGELFRWCLHKGLILMTYSEKSLQT